ncbi:MAG: transporter, family, multidrug resistance protein [Pseudonocardiales bacterium]|nr:transporter, family, multidrug resistance protein [Pseudonocardiales bacterium]
MTSRGRWIGLAVLALPCAVVTMDLTVLLLALPSLSRTLAPSSTELLWISDIYGFFVAASLVLMGNLGDRIGRRRVLLIGAAAFAATSLLAALSPTPAVLIVARALQGIAGATLAPSTMALVFGMFPGGRERTIALGVISACFSAGGALGPLIAGVLLEFLPWNWVFAPNLVVMAAVLLLGPRFLPEARGAGGPVDVPSAALGAAAVLAVVYGVKQAAHSGLDPVVVAALIGGAALGVAFVARQRRLPDPLLDLALFRNRAFSVTLAANVLEASVLFGFAFVSAQFLQLVLRLTPLQAALATLPAMLVLVVASLVVVPPLATRVRPAFAIAGGLVLVAAGFLWLTLLDERTGLFVLVPAYALMHLGIAPAVTLGMKLVVGAAPARSAGAAAGAAETGNELGGALGIALIGALGAVVYRAGMPVPGPAGDTLAGAVDQRPALPPPVLARAVEAFTAAVHVTAVVSASIVLLTAILVVGLLHRVPADPATDHGADPDGGGPAEPAPLPGHVPADRR